MTRINKVRLTVFWADEPRSLFLTQSEWDRVGRGEKLELCGDSYLSEGKSFSTSWRFNFAEIGELEVAYDDGGVGFLGSIDQAKVDHG